MKRAELKKLDTSELEALYLAESKRLYQALLDGTAWEELADQRKYVITIGVVIDARKQATKNALIAAALQTDFL